MYIASIKGLRQAVAKKRVMELLQRVGLAKVDHKKMQKLYGGMEREVVKHCINFGADDWRMYCSRRRIPLLIWHQKNTVKLFLRI